MVVEAIIILSLPVLAAVFLGGFFTAKVTTNRGSARKKDLEAMHDEVTVLRVFLHDVEELAWQNKEFEPISAEAYLQLARKVRNDKALQ